MAMQDMMQDDIRRDPDLAEHVSTYEHFTKLAMWAAIALPFFFAFVLYYTQ